MPLTALNTSFSATFQATVAPKQLIITDTTDYASIGVDPDTVDIYLKVTFTSSSGVQVLYDNLSGTTPDIDRANTSQSIADSIPLPLQTGGNIAWGTYVIEARYDVYDITVDPPVRSYQLTISESCEYAYTPPTVTIAYKINIPGSNITTTDTTNYGVYTSLARVHTISPPANAMLPPLALTAQSTSQILNVYQDITTGTWGAKVVTTVTTSIDDVCNIIYEVEGCIEFIVYADVDINALLCCLNNVKALYEGYLLSDWVKAKELKKTVIDPLELNLTFYLVYLAAGCLDKAATTLEIIRQISGCGSCSCGGDECPTPIPAITGRTNFYDIDSPNNTILVTSDVVGDTTTFHIIVNPAVIPTVLNYSAVGSGGINVSTTQIGNSVIFNISPSAPLAGLENSAVARADIWYHPVAGWQLSIYEIFTDTGGGIVQPFASHVAQFSASPVAGTDPVAFFYKDYFISNQTFVGNAQINNAGYTTYDETTILTHILEQNVVEANVMWTENDSQNMGNNMLIRLYNPLNAEILKFDDLDREQRYQMMIKSQAES